MVNVHIYLSFFSLDDEIKPTAVIDIHKAAKSGNLKKKGQLIWLNSLLQSHIF